MSSYNKCDKCSEHKEKNLLCLNEKCGRNKLFQQICIQCHRLQHRDSSQKITEDDIDLVLSSIKSSAQGNLKQIAVKILDKGMVDTINNLLANINDVIEQLQSIKTVFNKIVELSNSSHIEYENIIKRIDSITSRKDEDSHIGRQLNILKEKIIYNPEGKIQFIHEINKTLIKQNSSSFTQHCKKQMEKINISLQELFQFDTLILDTFVKKKGTPDTEDLSDLVKPVQPQKQEVQGQEEQDICEKKQILEEINDIRQSTLKIVNDLISTLLGKPFNVKFY
ncbi:hypothetical protein ABPG74_021285 [Tetrahymena malaccensis]